VIGAGAPAKHRGARAVLCAVAALAGVAVVLVVAGREPARQPAVRGGEARVGAALPAAVATESEVRPGASGASRPAWQPPVAARVRRDDGGAAAGPERYDSPSFEGDDWRDRVAAVLGRKAVEGFPLNPGAVHTHLPSAEAEAPEARAPSTMLSAPAPGSEGREGWDGGAFWFGPNGLVRMREAQR